MLRLSLASILIYDIDIRCLLKNQTELEYHLEQHRPHIVTLQETWRDASVEHVDIKGYVVVSRRDRRPTDRLLCGDRCGGILTLRRDDFNCLVHIQNSDSEERSWHFLRVQLETILLINWYRSPSVIHDHFEQLYKEMSTLFHEATGVLMIGDLNIHHKKWLRYSNADTTMGTELKTFCDFHGFFQIVREPTRKEYLLDLAITDIPKSTATVLPLIAGHNVVLVKLPLPEVLEKSFTRTVWDLRKAEWSEIEHELTVFDWSVLRRGTSEDALSYFLEIL